MAKKDKLKVDISVSGVSVEDLIKGKYNFDNVSDKSVKQMTSRLVSAMNKRIARLGKSEIGKLSPTYKKFERKGKYSVKSLSRSQTIGLFNELRESMSKKTSLSAFKEYRSDLYNKLGIDFKGDIETEKKFWEVYNKYEEADKENQNWRNGGGSPEVISYMFNNMNWEEATIEEKTTRINELYEQIERQEALKQEALESGYFEDEEDFYGFDEDDEELY